MGSLGAVLGSCSAWMLCWAAIGSSMQASRLAMRVGSCSALAAWMLCLGSRSGVHVLFMFKFMVPTTVWRPRLLDEAGAKAGMDNSDEDL